MRAVHLFGRGGGVGGGGGLGNAFNNHLFQLLIASKSKGQHVQQLAGSAADGYLQGEKRELGILEREIVIFFLRRDAGEEWMS